MRKFEPRRGEGPGSWVDYATHPAYQPLLGRASLVERARALADFAKYFGVIVIKRSISYEMIPLPFRKPRTPGEAARFTLAAMRGVGRNILGGRGPKAAPIANGVDQDLREHGICVVALTPHDFSRVAEKAQPLFDELRRTRGQRELGGRKFEESRRNASPKLHASLFATVQSVFEQRGILAGVSGYTGRKVKLVDINPQINDASDDFWLRTFPDLP
ncbi:MAG TPA: hypothetical protein VD867_10740, partial [Burkholderiales bacterium]|nr:hypothetical protein [Burkholderiales bacterium]